VLQADARHLVAQREQEVVVVVVARAVQLVHLLHEVPVRLQVVGLGVQVLRIVGEDVQAHRHLGARVEVEGLRVAAREHRRVHEHFEVHRLEADGIAGARLFFQRRWRTSSPPAASRSARR
jgi:hypothetical protein